MTTIVWFRQDLRLADNPALRHACNTGAVVPVHILDEGDPWPSGGASRWWLHHSLKALAKDLGGLVLLSGDPLDELRRLVAETGATGVVWNRCYEPHAVERDKAIKKALREQSIDIEGLGVGVIRTMD